MLKGFLGLFNSFIPPLGVRLFYYFLFFFFARSSLGLLIFIRLSGKKNLISSLNESDV